MFKGLGLDAFILVRKLRALIKINIAHYLARVSVFVESKLSKE